jgi:hypothetical protein
VMMDLLALEDEYETLVRPIRAFKAGRSED